MGCYLTRLWTQLAWAYDLVEHRLNGRIPRELFSEACSSSRNVLLFGERTSIHDAFLGLSRLQVEGH